MWDSAIITQSETAWLSDHAIGWSLWPAEQHQDKGLGSGQTDNSGLLLQQLTWALTLWTLKHHGNISGTIQGSHRDLCCWNVEESTSTPTPCRYEHKQHRTWRIRAALAAHWTMEAPCLDAAAPSVHSAVPCPQQHHRPCHQSHNHPAYGQCHCYHPRLSNCRRSCS